MKMKLTLLLASIVSVVLNANQTFNIVEGSFTWLEAKADAESRGGRLAVLDTQQMRDAANTYLQSLGTWPVLWIGGTDEVVEGDWKWINGQDVDNPPWGDNEPGGSGEDYLAIWHSGAALSQPLLWSDWPGGIDSSLGGYTGAYLLETTPLSFTLNGGGTEYSVSDCESTATGSLDIPSTYNGLPVTSIGENAFNGCTSLSSITIPNSVTIIGRMAFYGCTSLTSLNISDNVNTIEFFTFYNCASLTSINISENLTSIDPSAFYRCSSLNEITVSPQNSAYTSLDNSLYNKTLTTLIRSRSDVTEISLPSTVTTIEMDAYGGCLELVSITIPDTITTIGIFAFGYCSNLRSVTIPDSITIIDKGVFEYCASLTSFNIPDGVTIIDSQAFQYCTSLNSITIPDSVTNIGGNAFLNCSDLNYIRCEATTAPTIGPDWWTGSMDGAFGGVAAQSISVPLGSAQSYLNAGDGSTYDGLTVLTYVLTFALNAGGTEYSVTDCNIDASDSLDIPSTYRGLPVTSIGGSAFSDCSSLTSITIPDSVTSIGISAFYRCSSLTSITIGDGVTSIGISAFDSCSSLTSITIPSSVTSIGSDAFASCTSLASVKFEGDAPNSADQAFDNIQASYIIVEGSKAESYGGDGATYSGLTVVDTSKVATAANLYTKSAYDTIVAERDARPTQAAYDAVVAERDAKLTLDEVKDLRAGSTMITVENETATLSMEIEKSSDLTNWTFDKTTTVDIPIEDGVGTQFFRFKMADPDTTVTVTVGEDTIAGRPIGVFYFNGVEKAVLEFEKGTKYTFIQNDSSNATYGSIHHPLMFSTGDDGEHNDHGHYMSGVVFKLDGVTVNMAGYVSGFVAAIDRRIEWTVASDAPSTLHYWCHFHTGQGAAMTVTD